MQQRTRAVDDRLGASLFVEQICTRRMAEMFRTCGSVVDIDLISGNITESSLSGVDILCVRERHPAKQQQISNKRI
jgi:hypothetical protein